MSDQDYLRQALAQAKLGQGICAPNPAVGAVIVAADGTILGKGYHHGAGFPHAEIEAFRDANFDCAGATLYVSLEPCCVHGRTPPCTDAIIQQGIKRVVYGFMDPNPDVAGRGQQRLLQHNIACEHLPLVELDAFYQAYAYWWQQRRPWVTVKLAQSKNGKIAGSNGEPIQITGTAAKQLTYQLRREADAILTSAQTIIADNPRLTIRDSEPEQSRPIYVLDRQHRVNVDAQVLQNNAGCYLLSAHDLPSTEQGFELAAVMDYLGQRGCHHIFIEAGVGLVRSLLKAKLVNTFYLYIGNQTFADDAMNGLSPGEIANLPQAKISNLVDATIVYQFDFP